MKKKVRLILLLLVGVSIIVESKTYASDMRQETSIYFENTYIPKPDVEDNLSLGISKKPDAPNQNQKFPKTSEKRRNNVLFSIGMILLCLSTGYMLLKISEWIFYKKKRSC